MGTPFTTKSGVSIEGCSQESLLRMRGALEGEYGLRPSQTCESAAFSYAMVVRAALGLSAQGGKICAIVRDTLPGWIALATARILANAGADLHVLFILDPENHSTEVAAQLKPLEHIGVPLEHWSCRAEGNQLIELLGSCHNVLCALGDVATPLDEISRQHVQILNELSVPVHAIEIPPGVDPNTGAAEPDALVASSTLSLGAPLQGLSAGKDFVGRHYLCDISIPHLVYEREGLSMRGVFADQPVQQIFPGVIKATP